MEWIFGNWRSLAITFGLGFVLAIVAAIFVHNWDVDALEAKWDNERVAAVESAEAAVLAQCKANNTITEKADGAYGKELNNLRAALAAAKLRQPTKCVPLPATSKATGGDAASTGGEPAVPDAGVTTDALLDYGADAEQLRLQLRACQQFVADTWAANGQ